MSTTELQQCAIHEAGHATVAAYLRLPVHWIALHSRHDGGSPGLWFVEGDTAHEHCDSRPLDEAAVLTAGWTARSLTESGASFSDFVNRAHVADTRDLEAALSWIDRLKPPPSEKNRSEILKRQWDRSAAILKPRKAGVLALANALIVRYGLAHDYAAKDSFQSASKIRGEITGAELDALLEFAR